MTNFSHRAASASSIFVGWLTPSRLRAQAIVIAVCLWGVFAWDFSVPGVLDRAGNVKFQDFLPIYISARMIAQHRSDALYEQATQQTDVDRIIGHSTAVRVPNLYGPQVGLLFVPLAKLSFLTAASVWAALSLAIYFACVYVFWKRLPTLAPHAALVCFSAMAFPPAFHFFIRAQLSALLLLSFTAAWLAFDSRKPLLAGVALGFLVFKPQFLVAIPLILLLGRSWHSFSGLLISAAAQLGLAQVWFGYPVMRAYFDMLLHPARWIATAELAMAPVQMHSLRSFWSLLIPSSSIALCLYVLSSLVVVAFAVSIWASRLSLALRFTALLLAAILTNPHLFVYDLIVLAPAILLIIDYARSHWASRMSPYLCGLAYLAFLLPLFGPVAKWTHLQFSVIALSALLWILWCSRSELDGVVTQLA